MILLSVEEGDSFTTRLSVEKKMKEVLEDIENGLSFEDAIIKYSQDYHSKFDKGNIGWLSDFNLDEKGITKETFDTLKIYKVSAITPTIRTSRGIALFKIKEKKNRRVLAI